MNDEQVLKQGAARSHEQLKAVHHSSVIIRHASFVLPVSLFPRSTVTRCLIYSERGELQYRTFGWKQLPFASFLSSDTKIGLELDAET